MRLPKLFSKKESFSKRYLALLISDTAVRASLVQIREQGVEVMTQSTTHEYANKEDFVKQADACLQELSEESEHIDEVIFALESNWVTEKGIADERKPLLKLITTDLSLKAVGFVVIPEAIVQGFQEEGTMFSAILAEVSQGKVGLYLVHQGMIEKAEAVGRSHQDVSDVFEGIARFSKELQTHGTLPSQMVLYSFEIDEAELEAMRQSLLEANWAEHKVFLQQPTITIVSPLEVTELVIAKGGEAVARAEGVVIGGQNMQKTPSESHGDDKPKSFGIPMAESVLPELEPDEHELEKSLTELELAKEKKKKLKAYIIGSIVAGLIVVLIIVYFIIASSVQALVKITPKLETLSKDVTITVDPELAASDPEQMSLKGESVTTQIEGEGSLASTGRKLVGEPAKGQIIIYNKTDSDKTFEAGTIIKAGNITFTLDDDVTVGAAEARDDGTRGEDYGEATGSVTAEAIGEEGNLKEDTLFSVGSFASSSYDAMNKDAAFTGGSSREVKVVSEEDRTKLLAELKQELLKKAQEKLAQEAGNGKYILPTNNITVETATYSAETETEASEIKLVLKAKVTAVSYSAQDLKPIAQTALQSELPEGYTLKDEDPQVLSAPSDDVASGSAQKLTVNISAKAKPDYVETDIEEAIQGLTLDAGLAALQNKDTIQSVEIQLAPGLAARLGIKIPKDPAKINLEIL